MREYDPNHRYQVITCASADFTDEDMSFRTVAEARTRIAYLVKEYAADGRDLDGAATAKRTAAPTFSGVRCCPRSLSMSPHVPRPADTPICPRPARFTTSSTAKAPEISISPSATRGAVGAA